MLVLHEKTEDFPFETLFEYIGKEIARQKRMEQLRRDEF